MSFEGGSGGGGGGGKSNLEIQKGNTNKQILEDLSNENLSNEDLSDYADIIKDSTRSIEYKTVAIKELLKHPNGIARLKSFLLSNNIDYKIEDKTLAMQICIEESNYFKDWLKDLYRLNDIIIENIPDKNDIKEKVKKCLKDEDIVKLLNGDKLNYIKNLKADDIRKRQKEMGKEGSNLPLCEKYIEAIQNTFKEKLKNLGVPHTFISYIGKYLFNEIKARKYVTKNNIINTIELKNYFSGIINLIDNYILYRDNEKNKIELNRKSKESCLPELFLLEQLSLEIQHGKHDRTKWDKIFKGLSSNFTTKNLNIINSWPENEFKKKAKEILEKFGWKNYSKKANEYQKKLAHVKQGIEDGGYYFITLPDDETGENSNDEEKQILDRLEKVLFEEKDEERDKVNDIHICNSYDDIKNYLGKYDIKRDITDNFKEIFFNKLGLGFNYGFYKWNEMKIGNKNPKLEERRFNSIKTFLLSVQPKTKVNEDKLEKYIFGKIFSTHYEYSNCDDKKNLIKHFLGEWGIINSDNVKEWNCNKNGLDLDEFLTAFYEETNIAFAQNFQKWNKGKGTQFGLKSDIIEAIMKIAIDNAKNEIKSQNGKEKIFNILKAPICHTENGEDFGFNIDDNLYDHTNGARIKDDETKQELFDNIKYILGDSTSNPPSRTFKINGHGGGRTHNGVYTDQKSGVPMIRINGTDRFLLKNYGRYLTILGISGHRKKQQYQTDINNARNN